MQSRHSIRRIAAGAAVALGLLGSSAMAQAPAPNPPPAPPAAPNPMPANGEPVTPPAPMPSILANYKPVTAERLAKPEDGNWLMFRRTYDGWGYSPLAQITPANVGRLKLGLELCHRPGRRPPGAADRQQRSHVRRHPRQPGDGARCQDRQRCYGATSGRLPEDLLQPASDQPRRRTVGRQGAISPPPTRCWWRSTPRPARKSGPPRSQDYTNGYYMSLMPLVADGKVMVGTLGRRARHPRLHRGL